MITRQTGGRFCCLVWTGKQDERTVPSSGNKVQKYVFERIAEDSNRK